MESRNMEPFADDVETCLICGKELKKLRYWVHLLTDGTFTLDKEHPKSQGYFPVGPECAQKVKSGKFW